jgi:hypothetical protein
VGASEQHQVCERHYQPSAGKVVRVAGMDPTRSYDQEAAVGGPASDVAHMVRVKAISESPADPIEAANVTSDHVQGSYTDTQVKAILAHVEYAPQTVTDRAGLCDAAARFHPAPAGLRLRYTIIGKKIVEQKSGLRGRSSPPRRLCLRLGAERIDHEVLIRQNPR